MIRTHLNRIFKKDKDFLEKIFKNLGLTIYKGGYLGRKESWWNIHLKKKLLGSLDFDKKGNLIAEEK